MFRRVAGEVRAGAVQYGIAGLLVVGLLFGLQLLATEDRSRSGPVEPATVAVEAVTAPQEVSADATTGAVSEAEGDRENRQAREAADAERRAQERAQRSPSHRTATGTGPAIAGASPHFPLSRARAYAALRRASFGDLGIWCDRKGPRRLDCETTDSVNGGKCYADLTVTQPTWQRSVKIETQRDAFGRPRLTCTG